jgi:hypothetical protein
MRFMSLKTRGYDPEKDLQSVLCFLSNTYTEIRTLRNWFPTRLENSHDETPEDIRIWENNNQIVAIANPEGRLVYYIQQNPNYYYLDNEIITWIINHSISKRLRIHKFSK